MIKLFTAIFSIITGILFVGVLVTKVNVCHATSSEQNPYVLNQVSIHSVDDARGLNGHGDHPDDGWLPFEFEGVTYPGQHIELFGSVIDENCNEIPPSTPTSTAPPPTSTEPPPTATEPPPTSTAPPPTSTSTSSPPTETVVPPTNTPTKDPGTATPTYPYTETPTSTAIPPTNTPTLPPPPTSTIIPPTTIPPTTIPPTTIPSTSTPYPPKPGIADGDAAYPGNSLGTIYVGGEKFKLYQGVSAPDGSLLLPSAIRGAALYQGTIWIHRQWHVGWLEIAPGTSVYLESDEGAQAYYVESSRLIEYGTYPPTTGLGIEYVATCYKGADGKWAGVELFRLMQAKHGR